MEGRHEYFTEINLNSKPTVSIAIECTGALTWLVLLELREWPCSTPLLPVFVVDNVVCCAWIPLPDSCCNDKWLFADVIESDIIVFIGSDDSDMPESVTLEDIIDDIPSKIVKTSINSLWELQQKLIDVINFIEAAALDSFEFGDQVSYHRSFSLVMIQNQTIPMLSTNHL